MSRDQMPDTAAVLDGLKDFQRDTVDYVFRRLYLDPQPTRRFLIADEVGLGKTLVARGLIARTIEHLWDTARRIDIVYICSNADIARQNIRRLNITGQDDIAFSSRITLLPITAGSLTANKINFVSFTPGTSFNMGNPLGTMKERALLYWLLQRAWGFSSQRTGPLNLLQGRAGVASFRNEVAWFNSYHTIDEDIAQRFTEALRRVERRQRLHALFEDLCARFQRVRKVVPEQDGRDRNRFIGDVRTLLAETCLHALKPDLIVLDEFQRFSELLEEREDDAVNRLAQQLFNYADTHTKTRVVLLSATPYKMYTLSHERAQGGEDHYAGFLRTLDFLQPEQADDRRQALAAYRRELLRLGDQAHPDLAPLRTARGALERCLRQVMVRTERLAASPDRKGMLHEMIDGARLEPGDLHAYMAFQRVARVIGQPDTLEYWKSAPYLLNFMDGYQFKHAFKAACDHPEQSADLVAALADADAALLPWHDVEAYRTIDPRNARLRGLLDALLTHDVWKLLWMPPALPYYQLAGPYADPALRGFTKRLVFSAWQVAPKVIAALLSYEVERQIISLRDRDAENTPEARARRGGLLTFGHSERRLSGMPVLALLYPCLTLAQAYDPLVIAQQRSAPDAWPTLQDVFKQIRNKISADLQSFLSGYPMVGPEDQNWYWAAPLLLDRRNYPNATEAWFARSDLATIWTGAEEPGADDHSNWSEHVKHAREIMRNPARLGRPPDDLAEVLALLALGGPGIVALRAFWRMAAVAAPDLRPKQRLEHSDIRDGAAQIAWAFRTLFNLPEATVLVRGLHDLPLVDTEAPYWRRVLAYATAGGLQAVLDEYIHVLREALGLSDADLPTAVAKIAGSLRGALQLRTPYLGLDQITVDATQQQAALDPDPKHLRIHFALRFGDERVDEGNSQNRKEQVRQAFNSPFWPFVLATTSVGQEGLDFHTYCHAIVHWNLPANPVDLEQREGRIHRYKGHAVRKNLVERYGHHNFRGLHGDPWQMLFEHARKRRDSNDLDLVPYWVLPGSARIERHVPALPLSRDRERLDALRRALTLYRMVFGQNRQEDLVAYLLASLPPEQDSAVMQELAVSLEPPRTKR